MWTDQVSNPGPLIYESGALPTALRGPAKNLLLMKQSLSFETLDSILLCREANRQSAKLSPFVKRQKNGGVRYILKINEFNNRVGTFLD